MTPSRICTLARSPQRTSGRPPVPVRLVGGPRIQQHLQLDVLAIPSGIKNSFTNAPIPRNRVLWPCESEITIGWVARSVYRICAFPGLAVLRPAKPPPARVRNFLSGLLRCRFTRVTARSALRAAPDHVGPEVTCAVFRAIFSSNPGYHAQCSQNPGSHGPKSREVVVRCGGCAG